MSSRPAQQTISIQILRNIARAKDNQTMKFGQVTGYINRNIFLQKSCKIEAGRLVPGLFLFFKKPLFEVEARGLEFSFNIFQES